MARPSLLLPQSIMNGKHPCFGQHNLLYPQKRILKIWYLFQNAPFTTQINKRAASTLKKAVCLLYRARQWEHDEVRASYLAGANSPTQQEICREGRFGLNCQFSSQCYLQLPQCVWNLGNPYWFYSSYSAWKTIFLNLWKIILLFIRKLWYLFFTYWKK